MMSFFTSASHQNIVVIEGNTNNFTKQNNLLFFKSKDNLWLQSLQITDMHSTHTVHYHYQYTPTKTKVPHYYIHYLLELYF